MITTLAHRKNVLRLVFGAAFLLFGLSWLWWSQRELPKLPSPIVDRPLTVLLCVASLAAAVWFVRRYRARGTDTSITSDDRAEAGDPLPAERTDGDAGEAQPRRLVEAPITVRWLVRFGCVVSAIVLLGLATGHLLSVFFACVLMAVVVAFVFILFLVPRGL